MPDATPVPPEADIKAAARKIGHAMITRRSPREIALAVWPLIAAAERERLYAELGNDHYVIFTEDRWTVEHSIECRLSGHMPECAYHAAVARVAFEFDQGIAGRWRIVSINADGEPELDAGPDREDGSDGG